VYKLHWIKIFTTLQSYVQENEFRSFEVYCIILSTHFVKKKEKNTLKSNIIYNSASRVIRTHVFTSAEIESFSLRHRLTEKLEDGEKLLVSAASWWSMRSRPSKHLSPRFSSCANL